MSEEQVQEQGSVLGGTQAPEASQEPSNNESWYSSLPDELKSNPDIIKFKSPADLAKSYVHARRAISSDKVSLPGENATDDDWKQVYKKLGLPEQLDEYKVETPDGLDEGVIGQLREQAHKAGVLPKQFQQLVNAFSEINNGVMEEYQKQAMQTMEEAQAELKREWGPAYDKQVKLAQAAAREFGGEEAFNELNQAGLGNSPAILKMLAKAGSLIGEDKVSGEGNNSLEVTREEAQNEIAQIMNNPERPYWKGPAHPGYEKDKSRLLYLQGIVTGEQE